MNGAATNPKTDRRTGEPLQPVTIQDGKECAGGGNVMSGAATNPLTDRMAAGGPLRSVTIQVGKECGGSKVMNGAATNPRTDRTVEPLQPAVIPEGKEWRVIAILAHRDMGRSRQYLTQYEGDRVIDAVWRPRRVFIAGKLIDSVLHSHELSHNLPHSSAYVIMNGNLVTWIREPGVCNQWPGYMLRVC